MMSAHRSSSVLGAVAAAASAALITAAFVAVVPTSARAQDGATPPAAAAAAANPIGDIENAKFQFEGRITSNAVYVRSGPSENDYPTTKLDNGATVTVVGVKFDWLKVLPPDGSFCYVAKAFVEKRGDGKLGRVTNTLNVRVGSNLNPMKTKVASKLEPGTDVEFVGEKDEYFPIKPPKDVFLSVAKQFVEPVRAV